MTTNTALRPSSAHANCAHPATKADRARCRKAHGKAAKGATVRPEGYRALHVIEPCCCRVPFEGTICPLCDRPVG